MHFWRLTWKRVEEARPAAKPQPQLLCLADRAVPRALQLAPIAETLAKPTGEEGAMPEVEFRGAPAATAAPEPAAEAEGAPGPRQPYMLLLRRSTRPELKHHRGASWSDVNLPQRPAQPGPRAGEVSAVP
jgi:hypothetical protein